MKPLSDEQRRIVQECGAADTPDVGRQARIWEALERNLGAELPPTAAAAYEALNASAGTAGLSMSIAAKLGLIAGAAVVSGAVWWYAALQPPARTAAPSPPRPAVTAPAASAAPVESQPMPSSMLEETQLLAAAQRALGSGDPKHALELLDRHRRLHPQGVLAQERDAARILGLCALDRANEARSARAAFDAKYPSSLLHARIKQACAR